jgi:hypothetical protein
VTPPGSSIGVQDEVPSPTIVSGRSGQRPPASSVFGRGSACGVTTG